jgi:acyl-CoA synthetase (AMP-forming)/AMP-acid ligase II
VLAAAHLGITVIPVDWRTPAAEKQRIALRFGASLILSHRPGRPDDAVATLVIDDAWHARISAADTRYLPHSHCASDNTTLVINLSSGTTGTPKGALVSHQDFMLRMMRNQIAFDSLTNLRYLSAMPLCFGGGFTFCFLHLVLGNTVVLYPPLFSAEEIIKAAKQYKADFMFLAPAVLRWLLELPDDGKLLLPDLKVLMSSAAPLSAAEKHAVVARINPGFYEFYSSSAAGQIACCRPGLTPEKIDSVGKVSRLLAVEVVDESGQVLPAGSTGYVRCRGPGVSRKYHGSSENTDAGRAERMADGWCYTGDLAELDVDGFLYFRGRADDLIIKGGVNIYPGMIEEVLLTHPQIIEAAVVGRASSPSEQEVVAFVRTAAEMTSAELLAHCLQKLPAYAVPTEFHLLNDFPRTAAGKVRKSGLLSQLNTGSASA